MSVLKVFACCSPKQSVAADRLSLSGRVSAAQRTHLFDDFAKVLFVFFFQQTLSFSPLLTTEWSVPTLPKHIIKILYGITMTRTYYCCLKRFVRVLMMFAYASGSTPESFGFFNGNASHDSCTVSSSLVKQVFKLLLYIL